MLTTTEVRHIRRQVLGWYAAERRDFPWRGVHDPYAVMVSEVMLQQTQASRVAQRFPTFLRRFPDVEALAAADPGDVLAAWVGLGYNRRALALRRAAALVAAGGWPSDVAGLERLPGIGPYTARAIASLAFGQPVGVVDTNVRRWLLRRVRIDDTPRALQAAADALAESGEGAEVGDWTHASMELGATMCRARSPRCGQCPLAGGCPSRWSPPPVPITRQPALIGSDREVRGAIVRALAASCLRRMPEPAMRERVAAAMSDERWERVLDRLQRDGLIRRAGAVMSLGVTTIGA